MITRTHAHTRTHIHTMIHTYTQWHHLKRYSEFMQPLTAWNFKRIRYCWIPFCGVPSGSGFRGIWRSISLLYCIITSYKLIHVELPWALHYVVQQPRHYTWYHACWSHNTFTFLSGAPLGWYFARARGNKQLCGDTNVWLYRVLPALLRWGTSKTVQVEQRRLNRVCTEAVRTVYQGRQQLRRVSENSHEEFKRGEVTWDLCKRGSLSGKFLFCWFVSNCVQYTHTHTRTHTHAYNIFYFVLRISMSSQYPQSSSAPACIRPSSLQLPPPLLFLVTTIQQSFRYMAKAHEIGTSSIKKRLLLVMCTRFS